ncbi:MAG: tetratricopeptide repeat protein [Chloroflexota bacterium]
MLTPIHKRCGIGLAALVLLCGCSLNAQRDEPWYVTATPSPEAASEQTAVETTAIVEPSATPLPTVPPTPTIPPDVALTAATTYLTNGYYEDAVQHYRTVLVNNDAATDAQRGDAALGLAQAALREGLFEDAVDALTTFITNFPEDERIGKAHFLRGDAYMGLSRWAEAIADFEFYLARHPGLIDSYAYERIGDAQLGLGNTDDALASYSRAADSTRTPSSHAALRERIAQIHLNRNDYEAALEQYDAILAMARNRPYRASIELLAAQTLINSGDIETGMNRMRRIFDQYADQPQAYQAMLALLAQGYELDGLEQARVSFQQGDYEYTVEILNDYTTRRPLSSVPASLYMLLGRSYRELGNPTAAVTAFQTIIEQYPRDPLFGEALLEQGRTKFLSGDTAGAIEHYLSIANHYGYLPEAPEALWRAGYLYGTNGEHDKARAIFERLADDYPSSSQATSGLLLAASAAMSAGELTTAERLYGRLAVSATGEERAAAYLNAGRLALQRGDQRMAAEALNQAIAAAPDSYFSARAMDIVEGRQAFEPPARYRFQFDDAAEIAAAEAWLREQFEIEQDGPLWPLSETLAADERLIRGRELWDLSAFDEAKTEFSDLTAAYQDDGLASYQLAIYFRSIGDYSDSIVAAANVIRAAGVGTLDAPPYIARMRYPAYYGDVIQQLARERGIDPLLLLALIRHESLFDARATAAAGEKGLTQVIPSTAEYIARQLSWPDYQHSDLFRPYAGIAFGAYYLSEQLALFDGNAVAALAAYNAGPGRALNWLELSGSDPDLFMTAITIDSTRLYVQRIYSYYNIYRALYGDEQPEIEAAQGAETSSID